MRVRKAPMAYDQDLWRWVVEGRDAWYSMRAGEDIEIHLGTTSIRGTIHRDEFWSWYIVVNGVPLGLISGKRYTVTITI
ncbi:DUF5348 domain-containing protein [Alicyclobacillus dauci]|uniref:DUF5348 domain-containing protein n=1 Tax=Alicyclobacillus dauci TaxID=1475485 RepID=A0ABY6ZA15_9BACL|nr:DUF5348 domain-containing protein [Alicyclobacillus dauci]WAH39363.1 DUF5348 domain-containing protein [Alicyclobacillus dauci]